MNRNSRASRKGSMVQRFDAASKGQSLVGKHRQWATSVQGHGLGWYSCGLKPVAAAVRSLPRVLEFCSREKPR